MFVRNNLNSVPRSAYTSKWTLGLFWNVFLKEIESLNKRYVLCLKPLLGHYMINVVLKTTVTVKQILLNRLNNLCFRKEDRRSASVDSRQSGGSSKDTECTRHRRESSRSPSKRRKSRERGKDRDSRRKRER